jgi:benzoyl-CoA reductase/2-hydroxyglutaryl-CoA dehydratase subunit BcrC/BadD/HgdB
MSDRDAHNRPPASFNNDHARRLSFAKENSSFNRAWFLQQKARAEAGEPFAFINADIPTEIFKAMDIPVVVNQWWAAVVAAKQKSSQYLGALNARGYRQNLCKYCSLSYASTFETDPGEAPWGGLPQPTMFISSNDCNAQQKIFELWAERTGAAYFTLDRAAPERPAPEGWLDRLRDGWDDVFGSQVIDYLAAQYRELIEFLELHSGRRFDPDRLREIMALVNEQEDYYRRTRDLISATHPAPLNVADQMPATMIPQWHRGTPWGRDRAKLFYEETRAMVEAGQAVVADERVRLMWLGTGLWYNLGFYEDFEKRYGAVFVWSMYLAIAADAYPTEPSRPGEDPLRTLAGRMTKIYAILNTAPFNVEWFKAEALRAGIDGVVSLTGGTEDDCRETFGQHYLVRRAFEEIGVPVLRLGVDNADARTWNDDAIRRQVGEFIESRVLRARAGKSKGDA